MKDVTDACLIIMVLDIQAAGELFEVVGISGFVMNFFIFKNKYIL